MTDYIRFKSKRLKSNGYGSILRFVKVKENKNLQPSFWRNGDREKISRHRIYASLLGRGT